MCNKTQFKYNSSYKNLLLKDNIKMLWKLGLITKSCCCGHGKYPKTVIVEVGDSNKCVYMELISGIIIPRKKRFYKRDKFGFYYIPETL